MSDDAQLTLNEHPDGYGFLYGTLQRGAEHYRVDIMPPAAKWAGDLKLEGYEPDPEDYVVYLDGEEIARLTETDRLK